MKRIITYISILTLLFIYTRINAQLTRLTNLSAPMTEHSGWETTGAKTKHSDITNLSEGDINLTTKTGDGTAAQEAVVDPNDNVGIGAAAGAFDASSTDNNYGSSAVGNGSLVTDISGGFYTGDDPNPFGVSTMIKWNIPDDFKNAVLNFYDNSGSQVGSFKVNHRGYGDLQIFGSKLSTGIYTFTLVVDGKLIDSMKMFKEK